MDLFKAFALAFLIPLILTPIMIKIAPIVGYIDVPKDERRVHKKPVALLGGLAIFLAVVVSVFIFKCITRETIAYLLGGVVIVVSGLIDDKYPLSPKVKLLFQIIASIILVVGGVRIEFFTNPFGSEDNLIWINIFSIPATIFWVTGITNALNLIDGLDGLCAGVSGIAAISSMFLAMKFGVVSVGVLCAILAGACFGFLPYNFNPAKIFMGDTGALFLGYSLAYISIEGVMKSATILMIFVPVIILGIPVFDTAFAMIRRKLSGRSMVSADRGHLHHRLLAMGLSQRQTVIILYIISIIFGILANLVADLNSNITLIISGLIILAILLVGYMAGMFKGGGTE